MNNGDVLEPMEAIIAGIIEQHSEYHSVLDNSLANLHEDYDPEHGLTNPFLHMGLHIAMAEQLQTDRPPGIVAIYQQHVLSLGLGEHELHHRMMDCLAESLWLAQRDSLPPDECAYLDSLRKLR